MQKRMWIGVLVLAVASGLVLAGGEGGKKEKQPKVKTPKPPPVMITVSGNVQVDSSGEKPVVTLATEDKSYKVVGPAAGKMVKMDGQAVTVTGSVQKKKDTEVLKATSVQSDEVAPESDDEEVDEGAGGDEGSADMDW